MDTRDATVGMIGVGRMGSGVATKVMKQGFPLVVYDRITASTDAFVRGGAKRGRSAADVADQSAVVVTCLADEHAVRKVYFGADGILSTAPSGLVLVDCSTTSPGLAELISNAAARRGVEFVDAPILGGVRSLATGTARLVVGGSEQGVEAARHVLLCVAQEFRHVGPPGTGQMVKLLNNAVAIGTSALICEVFDVAQRSGVSGELLADVMSVTKANCSQLEPTARAILDDKHGTDAPTTIARKDLQLYLELAGGHRATSPLGRVVLGMLDAAAAMSFETENYTRVATMLAATDAPLTQAESRRGVGNFAETLDHTDGRC